MKKPRIGITLGDPAGIGPEVIEKALQSPKIKCLANFLIIKYPHPIKGFRPGVPNRECGKAALWCIDEAIKLIKNGKLDALVTAPVNKATINSAGVDFVGHTEYLAEATGTKEFAMMLCGGPLRVVPVTRHIALRDVPKVLTQELIEVSIRLTGRFLKTFFAIDFPRIGVCGLNPHCGEKGNLSKEEIEIIEPAIKRLKKNIRNLSGPVSADVIFYKAYRGEYDAVISMYHDQGLGPLKMLAFEKGFNVTIGLPFIRTSPDHGTAYDIAGKGTANPTSIIEAIKMAVSIWKTSNRNVK